MTYGIDRAAAFRSPAEHAPRLTAWLEAAQAFVEAQSAIPWPRVKHDPRWQAGYASGRSVASLAAEIIPDYLGTAS
jgi:hypothetical protein